MAGGTGRARDLLVADVPDQQMPEAMLGLALHRARARRTNKLLAGEFVQRLLHLVQVAVTHLRQRPRPEHLADHRGVLEQALPLGGEGVEAGGDQRLHRIGYFG